MLSALHPVRFATLLDVLILILAGRGFAADGPGIHRLDEFLDKGVYTALDRELMRHRLALPEIEAAGLDGRPRPIDDIVDFMARYEKVPSRIEEPLEVRGEIRLTLTPNTGGDEAYSTCFVALTYNGLVFSGDSGDLMLVRPETRPELPSPQRRWDRNHILSTRLFRLGFLNPDEILRRYKERIGTSDGHAVLQPRSNVLIVTDTDAALERLGAQIDAETLEALGVPARPGASPREGPRLPSPGAIASREGIHFYLMAFARSNRIPLVAAQQRSVAPRFYPEADLWTSERGFQALDQEYRRLGEVIPLTGDAVSQGWLDPHPERTLTPDVQKRLTIRFGLVGPLPGRPEARPAKKATRRRR